MDEFYTRLYEVWERSPAVLRPPLTRPLATEGELFSALCSLGDDARAHGPVPRGPKAYVDGRSTEVGVGDLLPIQGDGSLTGYAERIDRDLRGHFFQLYTSMGFAEHAGDIWIRMRELVRPLVEKYGIPPVGMAMDAFVGRYDRTSTGIHLGAVDTIMYVVKGRKKMLFWPPGTFGDGGDPDRHFIYANTLDYERYIDTALVLEAGPGEILCWPRHYWHIAASPGDDWTAVVTWGRWWREDTGSLAELLVAPAISRLMAKAGSLREATARPLPWTPHDPSTPPAVEEQLAAWRAAIMDPRVDEALREAWSLMMSGGGYGVVPELRSVVRPQATTVVALGDRHFPIVVQDASGDRLRVAANGHGLVVRRSAGIPALVKLLNEGAPLALGALLDRTLGASDDREAAVDVVEFLASARALELRS